MNETSSDTGAGGTKHRKLRFAFLATCGIICLLMVVLWVRSYWWHDTVICYRGGDWYGVESAWGVLHTNVMVNVGVSDGWYRSSNRLAEKRFPYLAFGWQGRVGGSVFTAHCSHWIPVLMFAALATAPWIKWRFSLRTLLIATTLVAVLLGAVVWAAK